MSVVIGYKQNGRVWMGADSQTTASGCKVTSTSHKLFMLNSEPLNVLIGVSGSLRTSNILFYSFKPPNRDPDTSGDIYINTIFIDAIKDLCKQNDFASLKDGASRVGDESQLLIGYDGNLYIVEEDFVVYSAVDNYMAIGSGEDFASGAMYAMESINTSMPRAMIETALGAACKHSLYCGEPYKILSI